MDQRDGRYVDTKGGLWEVVETVTVVLCCFLPAPELFSLPRWDGVLCYQGGVSWYDVAKW